MEATGPVLELLAGREVPLSPRRPMVAGVDGRSTAPEDTVVTRMLPQRHRRTIGAWCFVDHYGPDDVSAGSGSAGMQVAPHPHTGLQTVSWLLAGEIRHRDTVGSDVRVNPGTLALMTAGRGVAHSERSPDDRPASMHGVQLWVALPDAVRHCPPAFERHEDLPCAPIDGGSVRVVIGDLGGVDSPATTYTPLVAAEVSIDPGASIELPLDPAYEHAVCVVDGRVGVEGEQASLGRGVLGYLGDDRSRFRLAPAGAGGARLLLLGGEPFEEELVMWWNFVGRSQTDIELSRKAWNEPATAAQTFGTVADDPGDRMLAPGLPAVTLRPRGRTG